MTYPRQHLREYLSCKHRSLIIHNILGDLLLLFTLAIIPFRLQHNELGICGQRGKWRTGLRVKERRGRGRYVQWDDVILTWPEHVASVDGIRNLNLETSIVNSSNWVLIHSQNSLRGTNISARRESSRYKKVQANLVGPSRPLTESSVIPEGQIHPKT